MLSLLFPVPLGSLGGLLHTKTNITIYIISNAQDLPFAARSHAEPSQRSSVARNISLLWPSCHGVESHPEVWCEKLRKKSKRAESPQSKHVLDVVFTSALQTSQES